MATFEYSFYLLSGLTLLMLSGDKLVETAIQMARYWKVPASIVAVTIIAAGTSAPELVTSLVAGIKGKGDIAIGNVIGSNIFNILAVGGLSLLMQPSGRLGNAFMSAIFLVCATLLFYYCLHDLNLSSFEGSLLLVGLITFIVTSFFLQKQDDLEGDLTAENPHFSKTLLFFIASLSGLILGAELALQGGVGLGETFGLSERIIAITIISAGTGLPELATSIAAAYRGQSDIAIANIIGSNIFNTLAIPGATVVWLPMAVNPSFLSVDFYIMSLTTLLIFLVFLSKNHLIRRAIGGLFFLGYLSYLLYLIAS